MDDLTQRIAFRGWTNLESKAGIAESDMAAQEAIVDVSSIEANRDYVFYAVYTKENVYDRATDDEYFTFEGPYDSEYSDLRGYTIHGNTNYSSLTGKITIPAHHEGLPVLRLGNFVNALDASGIFFMEGSQLEEVADNAFDSERTSTALKGVYLPDTVKRIGSFAFRNVYSIEHISEHYAKENVQGKMPSSLITIGARAF